MAQTKLERVKELKAEYNVPPNVQEGIGNQLALIHPPEEAGQFQVDVSPAVPQMADIPRDLPLGYGQRLVPYPAAPPQFQYSPEIEAMRQRANQFEQQANTPPNPYQNMSPLRSGITHALRSFSAGYDPTFLPNEAAANRQIAQDKLARAKTLRGQADVQYGQETERQRYEALEAHQRALEAQAAENAQAEAQYRQDNLNKPVYQFESGKEGGPFGYFQTGGKGAPAFTQLGTNPAKNEGMGGSEWEAYVNLGTKVQTGTATPLEQAQFSALKEKISLAPNIRVEGNLNAQAIAAGRREVIDRKNDVMDGEQVLRTMEDAYKRVNSGKSTAPGADDMILLSNHIGMTIGSIKGGRVGTEVIRAHVNALSPADRIRRMWETVETGGQLTTGQRQEFIEAARARVGEYQRTYGNAQQVYEWTPPGEGKAPPETRVVDGHTYIKVQGGWRRQ